MTHTTMDVLIVKSADGTETHFYDMRQWKWITYTIPDTIFPEVTK